MKELFIVIDMQHDFINGALGSAATEAVVPAVKAAIAGAQKRGAEIVYTQDTHDAEYLTTQEGKKLPVPHCIRGTHGWEILSELYLTGARVFEKPTFGSTALAEYARAGGYDTFTLVGVCTDICVISNAMLLKAYCPEAEVRVIAAACAGTSQQNHAAALTAMTCCQIIVL